MSNIKERILEILSRHIIVKDSAIGTTLVGNRRDVAPDSLSLTRPEAVAAMYEASLQAGAKILTANTFLSDPLLLKSCGIDESCDRVVEASMRIAREAIERSGKEAFVAGPIGPSTRNITLATDLTEDELRDSFQFEDEFGNPIEDEEIEIYDDGSDDF